MKNTIKVKFGKIITTFILAFTLTLSMSITVFAKTATKKGTLRYSETKATATIDDKTASATTSYADEGAAIVSATYTYMHPTTHVKGSTTQNNGYTSNCSVYFNAPTNYQSYSINSSHSVTASGETWSTNLSLSLEN